jgi:hypothetical protein
MIRIGGCVELVNPKTRLFKTDVLHKGARARIRPGDRNLRYYNRFLHSTGTTFYSWALIVIVLLTASTAASSLISMSNTPQCLTLSWCFISPTNDIFSGERAIHSPFSSSANMAFKLAAMSFVDTDPYMLVFPCSSTSGFFACLVAASAAAAETADLIGIDGDILLAS